MAGEYAILRRLLQQLSIALRPLIISGFILWQIVNVLIRRFAVKRSFKSPRSAEFVEYSHSSEGDEGGTWKNISVKRESDLLNDEAK
ncbi:hypothetical protein ALC57_09589 [Trachymyrmex cornetzi]|uniref:Uncharacterized protein n=1 Tax=Trachymyrmex cornetzi TaxID=471704 RepID=A0A195DZ24_9HYME|nr:hypothetical protein ALC57_09589 [Trachymyrmex cornetzi]